MKGKIYKGGHDNVGCMDLWMMSFTLDNNNLISFNIFYIIFALSFTS